MKLTMLKIMLLLTVIFMKIEVTEAVSCNQVSNDFLGQRKNLRDLLFRHKF